MTTHREPRQPLDRKAANAPTRRRSLQTKVEDTTLNDLHDASVSLGTTRAETNRLVIDAGLAVIRACRAAGIVGVTAVDEAVLSGRVAVLKRRRRT